VTLRIQEFPPSQKRNSKTGGIALFCAQEVIVNTAQGNSLNLVVTCTATLVTIQQALKMGLPTFGIAQSH
jgi:ABC-2 type transport system ATP-binding protein